MEPLQPSDPRRISTYEIQNRLGAGGMGQVYLGRSASGRRVAVKVIRPELTNDPEFRARFRREVTSMKAVSGFFTAPVVDADPDGSPAWLATAFVPGPSLSEAVRDRGPMPQRDVLVLAAGLAEALSAIHKEGLTHRDLKPANVLLADDGPRVIDFGLAVTAASSAVTQAGTVVGTPSFMSPEQISGKPVGPASDVFSLGSVLAHAATGRAPYGEGGTMELMYRVVNNEPDLAGISGTLLHLVSACLQKDPAQRPSPARILQVLSDGAGVEATAAMGWVPPKLAQPPATPYVAPPTVPNRGHDSGPQQVVLGPPIPVPGVRDSGPRAVVGGPAPHGGAQYGGGIGVGGGGGVGGPSYPNTGKKSNRTALLAVAGSVVAVAGIAGVGIALSGGGSPGPTTTGGPTAAPVVSSAAVKVAPGAPVTVELAQLFSNQDAAKALRAPVPDLNIGAAVDDSTSPTATYDQTWDVRAGASDYFLNSVRIQATLYTDKTEGPKKAAADFAKHASGAGYTPVQLAGTEKASLVVAPDAGDKKDSLQDGVLEILRGNLDVTVTFNEMKVDTATAKTDLTAIGTVIGSRLPSS